MHSFADTFVESESEKGRIRMKKVRLRARKRIWLCRVGHVRCGWYWLSSNSVG